ncbi:MAG: fasciclin domain-containing protein [Caldilineaceae bacterium]|nr:fasciclin domain-containing protein [Caldilineaceae bacterium]HRJ41290.1 fasciclin domain-containing protein [Caldilineaceae bacterium]
MPSNKEHLLFRIISPSKGRFNPKILFGLFCAGWILLFASPLAAQSPVEGSAAVTGSLTHQYSRHVLIVRAWDRYQPLILLLEYSPQERWELDDRSGFFVFDQKGYDRYQQGEIPGSVAVAAGDRLPGEGRRLQATIGTPFPGPLYVMVYNDSPLPMGYTLRATNGGFYDSQGQVIDKNGPAPASGGDAAVFPLVIAPGPTPTPGPIPTPAHLRASAVRGVLDARYDFDEFTLEVVDLGRPLIVEMIYDPPDQIQLLDSFNFWIFDEDQVRTQTINGERPEFLDNRAAGRLVEREHLPLWTTTIEEPLNRYTIIVNQHVHALSVGYRLTVINGILTDERGQSRPVPVTPPYRPGEDSILWLVSRGDTLGSIAQAIYGDPRYYTAICAANSLSNCSVLVPGQRLVLPPASQLPPLSAGSGLAVPARPSAAGAPVAGNLLEVAAGESRLQAVRDLIGQTSLQKRLSGAGSYTLFAFSNGAFDALSIEAQDELLIDTQRALALLSYHVIEGRLQPDWVTRPKQVATLTGRLLRLAPDGAAGFTVNGVPVVGEPIEAANGLIYVIESVLE